MQILTLTTETLHSCAEAAVHAIREGKVVLIPTDTCYGLAVDPSNPKAVEKLFAIKRRADDKKVSLIYPSIVHIEQSVLISPWQKMILQKNLPGPFTFIINGVGIRIPEHPFTQALAETLGDPYTATSANISGNPPLYSAAGVIEEFGKVLPDLVIDAGELPNNPPSAVIDLSNDKLQTIRAGARVATQE